MFVDDKYFSQDKNYLLKTVQAFSKENLLDEWLVQTLYSYNSLHNPMGLEDDFILILKQNIQKAKPLISENYDILAAIYRLRHGDNQLEFMWDGRTHMEQYDSEWKNKFSKWVKTLSDIKEVQRPIIRYATSSHQTNNTFLHLSIRKAILSYFNVKFDKRRNTDLLISA